MTPRRELTRRWLSCIALYVGAQLITYRGGVWLFLLGAAVSCAAVSSILSAPLAAPATPRALAEQPPEWWAVAGRDVVALHFHAARCPQGCAADALGADGVTAEDYARADDLLDTLSRVALPTEPRSL